MRWWHAVIVAVGLALGGALSGGLYTPVLETGAPLRMNRFTGAIDAYYIDKGTGRMGWMRLPESRPDAAR